MATTIEIPLELDSVDPTNGNAGWNVVHGQWYQGVYRFFKPNASGPIANRGLMTFRGNVPKNLASPAAWNLVLHHTNASGDAGAVLLRVEAGVMASGDTPVVLTTIVPNQLVGVRTSGDHNVTVLSGSNFDGLVALTAGDKLTVQISRMPLGVSGDSVSAHWDLTLPPLLRCDVT